MGKKPSPADVALERLREICLAFPSAEEKISHGAPSFKAGGPRGKLFVMFVDDHHHDGRIAVWCKATHETQRRRVAADPEHFFVPPYVGVGGWVGARLDRPDTDWIDLAILIEEGWTAIAPKNAESLARAAPARKKPPPRPTTDAKVAKEAFARLSKIAEGLPEVTCERESQHATWRVRKKVFAYFLDNHHGDGRVAVCVKVPKAKMPKLLASDSGRYYSPAYIGPRGYLGVRLDGAKVDWKDVGLRLAESYRVTAPKSLAALA
jgi:hypothetical protein